MKAGNILALIGGIFLIFGLLFLPINNFHELPFMADSGYAKGGGFKLIVQTGIFARPAFLLFIIGGILLLIGFRLPKKYWASDKDLIKKEINKINSERKKDT